MIPAKEAIRVINELRGDSLVVNTMTPSRYWDAVSNKPELDLPIYGAMGKASSVGLGLALARPERRVLILDGDGSLLMNLGSLVTIAEQAPINLIHFVFEDGAYQTTGGQPVPGAGVFNFALMAKGAGFREGFMFEDLEHLVDDLPGIIRMDGPIFVCLKVYHSDEAPASKGGFTGKAMARLKTVLHEGHTKG